MTGSAARATGNGAAGSGQRTWLADVGGHKLRVCVRPGDGRSTPLLLMNGIGASLEALEPLVVALDPSLEVIRFDAPGIGGSSLSARPYRFSALSRLLGRLLDDLGHDQVDVLGISWGGGLAQQFARTERRRCRRLVLVSTGTGSLMVPGSPLVLTKLVTPRRYRDPGYLRSIAGDLYGGLVRTDPGLVEEFMHGMVRGGQLRGYLYQLLAGAGWTSLPFLPLLPQRTLVLTGNDDPIIHPANGRILAGLIRRSRLHIYPGGHVDLVADPSLLVPMIQAFLAEDGPH
jgi:poly(3-hydroxyalkanoate) depolymerase